MIKKFLRDTGRMFPVTPEQVDAFEQRHRKKEQIPELLSDPIAILERGYIEYKNIVYTLTPTQPTQSQSMAARSGLNLSADTLRKMEEDRQKAESED